MAEAGKATAQEKIITTQEEFIQIEDLSSRNENFRIFQKEIEKNSRLLFSGKSPELKFYSYTCKKNDQLIPLSSRTCIPYDTVATLNSIENPEENLEGKTIYLPTLTGIFITETPSNRFEILLKSEYSSRETERPRTVRIGNQTLDFYINRRLTPSERAFFLSKEITLPLKESVITSSYGMRLSPISGRWSFHNGIDMASPEGSDVFACRGGIVKSVTYGDEIYGNYIVVEHSRTLTSLYAHLGAMTVKENQKVSAGQKIAEVGLTGLTTGPHLHFEIKNNGKSEDPAEYIKK